MPSVVAIVKDEGPYIAEWIAFHRLQGFDRILLYDNDSSDDTALVAEVMGAEVHRWPGRIMQLPAYTDACARRLDPDDWAAFIDVDEYLWRPDGKRVVDMLPTESTMGVGVPWLVFGDNGYQSKPPGLTIDSYLHREAGPNPHVKQILRPRHVERFLDPHHTNVPYERSPDIFIAHYWTRSKAECEAKFLRGRADYPVRRKMREFYDSQRANNAVFDDRLSRWWGPSVRLALGDAQGAAVAADR
jgi:hypothetical protein